jgi:hypothetical protein
MNIFIYNFIHLFIYIYIYYTILQQELDIYIDIYYRNIHLSLCLDLYEHFFLQFCLYIHLYIYIPRLQQELELPIDKRSGRRYGPPASKRLIFFIDDMNLPYIETYGTQNAIALLTQHMSYGTMFDRTDLGSIYVYIYIFIYVYVYICI